MEGEDSDRVSRPTFVSPITNVIVKASVVIDNHHQDQKGQRSQGQSVLMTAGQPKTSVLPTMHYNQAINSPTEGSIVTTPGVIRSTKAELFAPLYNIPSTSKAVEFREPVVCADVVIDDSDEDNSEASNVDNDSGTSKATAKVKKEKESTGGIAKRDNPRDARNKAEKQRRDRLNKSINELATLVPLVAESSRKIDKTGVLRLTAYDLRKEHVFGDSNVKNSFMSMPPQGGEMLADLFGGFLLTVTWKGIVVLITANIEKHLGHCRIDLLGQNLINYTHPEDHGILKHELIPHNIPMGPNNQFLIPPEIINNKDKLLRGERRNFYVRLARATQRSENPQYVLCQIEGVLRIADKASGNTSSQVVRRHRSRGDETITTNGNDIVLVGMVRIVKPPCFSERLMEASKMEYRTRHLIDGRIIQCDERIALVAGYMTNEITGVSAFTFMHKDDVRWVIITLRQMYDSNIRVGESCYRLIARNGRFIFLKTRGYLEIDPKNHAVESFVCINTLITEEEGQSLIKEMKQKYSVIIGAQADQYSSISDGSSLEDPLQVEEAIMHLVTNLPSPACIINCSPNPIPAAPPLQSLSIIPPKTSTIKNAIAKSMTVINQSKKVKCDQKPSKPITEILTENESQPILSTKITQEQNNIESEETDDFLASFSLPELLNQPISSNVTINEIETENIPKPTVDMGIPSTATSESAILSQILGETKHLETVPAPIVLDESLFQQPLMLDCDPNILKDLSDTIINNAHPSLLESVDNLLNCDDFISIDNLVNNLDENLLNQCEDVNVDANFFMVDNLLAENNIIDPPDETPKESLENNLNCDEMHDLLIPPLGPLKRARNNQEQATNYFKKKASSSDAVSFSENIEVLEDILPVNNPPPEERPFQPLNNLENPQERFETYIHELTDPNSDLCEVVPRSLAALESSISQMNNDFNTMNNPNQQFEQNQQQNLTDIITRHEEQKHTLETIQQDYESSVTDNIDH